MKVLVTGGGGFLGAWIIKRLLEAGHEARVFDRSENRTLLAEIAGLAAERVEWVVGDITDEASVAEALAECQGVIHLAALLTPACQADPVLGARVNLIGTLNVFEAAKSYALRQVVYASSAGVFSPQDGIIPRPTTHYGAFKLACEGCARAYWEDAGIASVGFRPLVIYGPGREVGGSAGPSLACRAAARGEPYVIPITGTTDMIYVDDVAAAFAAAATQPVTGAHVFNLRGEVASIDHVVEVIRALSPGADISAEGPPLPVAAEIEAHHPEVVLGPLPRTSLKDGLSATLAHYRALAAATAPL